MNLYEILVPTKMGACDAKGIILPDSPQVPVSIGHHKMWDEFVKRQTGGLTILSPGKGQWVDKSTNTLYTERVIPVRIACSERAIHTIAEFTKQHYRQLAVMFYLLSDKVYIV